MFQLEQVNGSWKISEIVSLCKKNNQKISKNILIFWFYNPSEKKEDSEVLQTVKNRFPIIFLSVILTK